MVAFDAPGWQRTARRTALTADEHRAAPAKVTRRRFRYLRPMRTKGCRAGFGARSRRGTVAIVLCAGLAGGGDDDRARRSGLGRHGAPGGGDDAGRADPAQLQAASGDRIRLVRAARTARPILRLHDTDFTRRQLRARNEERRCMRWSPARGRGRRGPLHGDVHHAIAQMAVLRRRLAPVNRGWFAGGRCLRLGTVSSSTFWGGTPWRPIAHYQLIRRRVLNGVQRRPSTSRHPRGAPRPLRRGTPEYSRQRVAAAAPVAARGRDRASGRRRS